MKISREFIMEHRTDRGAWTKAQLSAIGVKWPPEKGWINRVVGRGISEDQRVAFINGAKIRVKAKP